MTIVTDAFLVGIREYGERLYLDCYAKEIGRKLINVDDKIASLKRFSLLRLAIYSNQRGEYCLSSYETIISSEGYSSKTMDELEIVSQIILSVLGKDGTGKGYSLLANCIDSIANERIDFRYIVIRASLSALELCGNKLDLKRCSRCGLEESKTFEFYFNVAKIELSCSEHVDADSFRIYPRTLEIFRSIVYSIEDDLIGCNFLDSSVSYIVYLMFECVAYRYGIYNILAFEGYVSKKCLK